MMGMAAQTGEPQVCSDCRQDNMFTAMTSGKKPVSYGSVISCPIICGQKTVAAINVSYPLPDQLNEWQKRLIPVFCRFLGQLLTSNRLLNNLEKEVHSRTSQLDSLLDETRRMEQHYQELAMIDDLTGIYNRRFFFLEAKRVLGRAVRHFHPFSLLVIDLDRFKQVNDTYGHAVGDMVLQDAAAAVRGILRETDVLARTGGEEFAIALPETDASGTMELAARVLTAVNKLSWHDGGDNFRITVSIGYAHISAKNTANWHENPERPVREAQTPPLKTHLSHLMDRLYSEADTAMYTAKRKGGNQVAGPTDVD
jgi:diguanylate cyclase (GGDEF)-like protein